MQEKGTRCKDMSPNRSKKSGDDSSTSSKSSKDSLEEFGKKLKNAQKQFAQLKAQVEEDGDESDEDDFSHFQFMGLSSSDHDIPPERTYREVSMKQYRGKLNDLNLRKIILLDNQSTMSLFCNAKFVTNVRHSDEPLTLHSNGGSLEVHHMASIGEGKPDVWFSDKAITNILSLKEVIKTYHVTYDSHDEAFIVYRQDHGMPNMIFRMHSSGLHIYDPKRSEFSFVVTVEDNLKSFSRRQIAGAERAPTNHSRSTAMEDHWRYTTWQVLEKGSQTYGSPTKPSQTSYLSRRSSKRTMSLTTATTRHSLYTGRTTGCRT